MKITVDTNNPQEVKRALHYLRLIENGTATAEVAPAGLAPATVAAAAPAVPGVPMPPPASPPVPPVGMVPAVAPPVGVAAVAPTGAITKEVVKQTLGAWLKKGGANTPAAFQAVLTSLGSTNLVTATEDQLAAVYNHLQASL